MNSTLHGGKRVGAGRKKKSNIEKLENGNPGGRKLTEIDIGEDLEAVDMPPKKNISMHLKEMDQYLQLKNYLKKHTNGK